MGKIEQPLEYEIKNIKLNKKVDEYHDFQLGSQSRYHTQALCRATLVQYGNHCYNAEHQSQSRLPPCPRFGNTVVDSSFASVQQHGTRLCMYPCILGSNNCVMFLRCVFSSGERPAYVSLLCFSDRLPIGIEPCQLPLHHAAEYLTG